MKGINVKFINSENAPAPIGPYSQAIVTGELIFTSGQIALDPETGKVVSQNIEEQTHRVIKNLEAVLIAGNSNLSKVVKTTIYLADMDDFATVNDIYAEYFGTSKPARSTIEVSCLPKNVLIEIDCIAVK